MRPLGRGARPAHRLGELQPTRDVGGHRREILQLHELERWRLLPAGSQVADHAHRARNPVRGEQRGDHRRARRARGRQGPLRLGLVQNVVGEQRLPGPHDPPGDAAGDRDVEAVELGTLSHRRGHVHDVRAGAAQRHVGALGIDQARHALQRVAQQQLALRRREQPARQLHEERPEPALALEAGAPRHHDGEVRRDFEPGAQRVRRESRGKALEPRADVAPLGVVIVRDEGVARLPGDARLGAARLAQTLVAELDPRAAGPLAQDSGGGVPEGPRLLRLTGFRQQFPDGV